MKLSVCMMNLLSNMNVIYTFILLQNDIIQEVYNENSC